MVTSNHSQPLLNSSITTQNKGKKILFISLVLATLVSLAYVGLVSFQSNQSNPIKTLCDESQDPTSCLALIVEAIPNEATRSSISSNDQELLQRMLLLHVAHINKAIDATKRINVLEGAQAVEDCLELMDLSRDRVTNSIESLAKYSNDNHNNNNKKHHANNDVTTWLSAVLTNYVTCSDQIENYSHLSRLKSRVEELISSSKSLLAIQSKVLGKNSNGREDFLDSAKSGIRKKLYPSWVMGSDRKLLEVSAKNIDSDVVVAKDGSGDFATVAEAVASAPDGGKKRYVIYVKEGVYEENVEVGKKKKNVMIVGDGNKKTVITGSLNVADGSTTFKSATLAAVGDGFILQDICIQNTAGPEKHQAVALRVGADQSVINRCQIEGYQDTLYTHSLRQFYTDSSILGTVDFVFGNAAVVLQNCKLIARRPNKSQKNMITAQGRTDPNQNTGTSIQYCDIVAGSDLAPVQGQFPTFLGRPWKEYSRTVILQSSINDLIDPKGWFEWDGDFALATLYYGEYKNSGPGADTSRRVNWPGYHVIKDSKEAKKYTVGELIQGQEWLDDAGVTYVVGL